MNNVQYGFKEYDSIKPIGDKILIEKMKNDGPKCVDGIYVPESKNYKNCKIGIGRIVDIGDGAKKKYSLDIGDYVLYDYYSAHGDWEKNIITDGENIILQLTEKEAHKFLNESLNV